MLRVEREQDSNDTTCAKGKGPDGPFFFCEGLFVFCLLNDDLCVHFAIAWYPYRMHIDDPVPQTWRLLLLVWSLGLLLWGCASAPQVKVAAEVFDPKEAKNRSVAVIADQYVDDPAEAEKLADLIRNQLTANGFKVQQTENEAELVVIPTIERSKPASTGTAPVPRALRSFDLSYGVGGTRMTESQNALRNLGFEFGPSPTGPEELKAGLMVTAVTREAWFKALLDEKNEIPRVWRITAVSPLKKEDITPKLVEAVGSKLNEVAGGKATGTEKPHPAPSASPRKKSAP
jgi:hypothetical protein